MAVIKSTQITNGIGILLSIVTWIYDLISLSHPTDLGIAIFFVVMFGIGIAAMAVSCYFYWQIIEELKRTKEELAQIKSELAKGKEDMEFLRADKSKWF